jgi:tRNA nucleotidyltransferase (CCA-adding enzyme)
MTASTTISVVSFETTRARNNSKRRHITKEGVEMKKYLVGGAVRDMQMGIEPKDLDYVVVGATHEQMIAGGFEHVGADFPVFLHPVTSDEYALARREKKTGVGYVGFTSEFGVGVTLEEDLGRRDITVNSMAYDIDEGLIDPFNGQDDVANKVLRHTGTAFVEDPVRVLRIARLRARFGSEWTVAPETKVLIYRMAKSGILNELQADRVWKEMSRALMEPNPQLFFDTLLECDALHVIFPEIYKLLTALESNRWHPEKTALAHTMLVLEQSARFDFPLDVRFACLVHDIGKGLTRFENLPSHFGHDVNGVALVEAFANRISVPAKIRDHAKKATRYHMSMHKLSTLNDKTFVKMFDAMSVKNDPRSVEVLLCVGICDERGRLGSENNSIDHLNDLTTLFEAYDSVKFTNVFPNGQTNVNKIKDGMFKARIQAIKSARASIRSDCKL